MANQPANVWLITEQDFDEFTCTGGKVVYIVEEPESRYASHPAIVTAGALLPPIDSIQLELDGYIDQANSLYICYLNQFEPTQYIAIILAAAIQGIPIGIMFGRDELNMRFPQMLVDYFCGQYGMYFGVKNQRSPFIAEAAMPVVLAKLYELNIIDYKAFMEFHPNLPIHPSIFSKLAYEQCPPVSCRDLEHYIEYFETVKQSVLKNGKLLIEPFIGD